jgi:predicted O-linked N-acetylglucosamine transferase (SPINDLY family)
MGVTECIAQSPAQYVEIALRLGTETAYRAEIKAKLLANNAALYADGNIVRELEHFFAKTLSA